MIRITERNHALTLYTVVHQKRRRIRLHLAKLMRCACHRAWLLPRVEQSVVRVPTVVGGKERNVDPYFSRKANKRTEVRIADRSVEGAPVVLDSDGDHRARSVRTVPRGKEVDKLRAQRAPELRHPREERGVRLAEPWPDSVTEPHGKSAARKGPTDAGADAEHDFESRGGGEFDRAAQVAGTVEDESVGRRLMERPRDSNHNRVEACVPKLAERGLPRDRINQGRVKIGGGDGDATCAAARAVEEETQGVEGNRWHRGNPAKSAARAAEPRSSRLDQLGRTASFSEENSPTIVPHRQKGWHLRSNCRRTAQRPKGELGSTLPTPHGSDLTHHRSSIASHQRPSGGGRGSGGTEHRGSVAPDRPRGIAGGPWTFCGARRMRVGLAVDRPCNHREAPRER